MSEEKRLHPILSNDEVQQARDRAQKKLAKEQKDFALKAVEDAELTRLREEEFQTVGGPEMDMVCITIDLPSFADKLMVNWKPYWHGQTYTLRRHMANNLAEMMQRAWQHENREVLGKKLQDFYQQKRNTVFSPVRGTVNAPKAAA